MGITDVKPGDTIKIKRSDYDEGILNRRLHEEIWTIVAIYPHHVLAVRNGIRECFTYGELIQLRLEKQKPQFEAMRQNAQDMDEEEMRSKGKGGGQ